jgi:hypothetical protein
VPSLNGAHAEPHTHDGFIAQVGLSVGYASVSDEVKQAGFSEEYKYTVGAGALDVLFGGTVFPGLALGAGLTTRVLVDPTVEIAARVRVISDIVNRDATRAVAPLAHARTDRLPPPSEDVETCGPASARRSIEARDASAAPVLLHGPHHPRPEATKIEHIQPRRHREGLLDWNNLVACCDGRQGQRPPLQTCDTKKADTDFACLNVLAPGLRLRTQGSGWLLQAASIVAFS